VIIPPFDALGEGRIAVVADPAGAVFGVWQPGAHRGVQLVNEPGAWSMSQLSTSDPIGRTAVLADPQGAVLSVSKVRP
jgi:predicted enzyme related to lactoylglutathione lyase